jgi:hypothetical protein
MSDLLRLKIRSQYGEVIVELLSGMCVKDLKDAVKETDFFADVDYENQRLRLVFSGRILDDDEKTLSHYNIVNDSVIHAVLSDRVSHGNSSLNDQNTNPENTMDQQSGNGITSMFGGANIVFVDGNTNQSMGQINIPGNGSGMEMLNAISANLGTLGLNNFQTAVGIGNTPNIANLMNMFNNNNNNNNNSNGGGSNNNNINNNGNNNDTSTNSNNESDENGSTNTGAATANNDNSINANNNINDQTSMNTCTHVLSIKNLDENFKCSNCNGSFHGMPMGCTRCRFFVS